MKVKFCVKFTLDVQVKQVISETAQLIANFCKLFFRYLL